MARGWLCTVLPAAGVAFLMSAPTSCGGRVGSLDSSLDTPTHGCAPLGPPSRQRRRERRVRRNGQPQRHPGGQHRGRRRMPAAGPELPQHPPRSPPAAGVVAGPTWSGPSRHRRCRRLRAGCGHEPAAGRAGRGRGDPVVDGSGTPSAATARQGRSDRCAGDRSGGGPGAGSATGPPPRRACLIASSTNRGPSRPASSNASSPRTDTCSRLPPKRDGSPWRNGAGSCASWFPAPAGIPPSGCGRTPGSIRRSSTRDITSFTNSPPAGEPGFTW